MLLFGAGCAKKGEPLGAPAKKEEPRKTPEPKRTDPVLAQYDYLWDTHAPPVIKDASDWLVRPDVQESVGPDVEISAAVVDACAGELLDVADAEVVAMPYPSPAPNLPEVKVIKAQQALVAEYGDSVEVLQKDAEELKKLMVLRRQSMEPKAYRAWRARLSLHLQKLEPELRTANPD